MTKTVFYARVSTKGQKADMQLDAAKRLGVPKACLYVEKASGAKDDRPVLAKALAVLEKGDTLAVYKLDRIGRSLAHVSKLLADLEAKGIHFRTVEGGMDTSGPSGKLVLGIMATVAQFERDLIRERVKDGLAAAKARGQRMGPVVKATADMAARAERLMRDGMSATDTAKVLGVSRRTLFRGLREARDKATLAAE